MNRNWNCVQTQIYDKNSETAILLISDMSEFTVGTYLNARLRQLGITEAFAVPGDFNLNLLDSMFPIDGELKAVACPNELIAGKSLTCQLCLCYRIRC